MIKIEELNGVDCIDGEDLDNVTEQLLYAAQKFIELQTPVIDTRNKLSAEQEIKAQLHVVQKEPLLVIGMAVLAQLNKFRVDYAYQQNNTQLLIQDVIESIDCAGAKAPLDGVIKLTVLTNEQALAALKERWLNLHQEHTGHEYRAAIIEFEKLVGL